MPNKVRNIILILSILIFAIIYPYTKEIEKFRASNITWKILQEKENISEFNANNFAFVKTHKISNKIKKLEGTEIIIDGFFNKGDEHDNNIIYISETVTDVCFMCTHDEHYNAIILNGADTITNFDKINKDTYIKVSGIFKINTEKNSHIIYYLENPTLIN